MISFLFFLILNSNLNPLQYRQGDPTVQPKPPKFIDQTISVLTKKVWVLYDVLDVISFLIKRNGNLD